MKDVAARERGDEGVRRLGDELRRRRNLTQAALHEHADAIGERRRVFEVVRDEQRRKREVAEDRAKLGPHLGTRMRIERGHRLVEQQYVGLTRERSRKRDSLALAAGELAGPRVREVVDVQSLEQAVDTAPERDVSLDGQVREERVLLKNQPDGALLGRDVRACVEPRAATFDPARARTREARDRAQDRRLAGARRADERQRLPRRDLERYVEVEGAERNGDVKGKRVHNVSVLIVSRIAAPTKTNSTLIATAESKLSSNWA
jgi:hypothetical protein